MDEEPPVGAAAALHAGSNLRLGVVVRFEAGRGLGTVLELTSPTAGQTLDELPAHAAASYPFHSTAIAGGSRKIAAGTAVAFVLSPTHGGTIEARELHPLAPAEPRRGIAGR